MNMIELVIRDSCADLALPAFKPINECISVLRSDHITILQRNGC